MEEAKDFCTCSNISCKLHPSNQDKGCNLCINKNLKSNELPNCFFNLIENSSKRSGDSFKEFAKLIIENEKTLNSLQKQ